MCKCITTNSCSIFVVSIKQASNKVHSNTGSVMLLAGAPAVSTATDGVLAAGQAAAFDCVADTAAKLAAGS